jgi:predicted nucleic acid-binding protein
VALVVDASMIVAWFVIGQATTHTRKVLARAGSEVLHAPTLLQIELASALVKLAHRRKITPAAIGDILAEFEALDLVTDRTPPTARTIASMCRRYALSAYDAAYFELAMRLELPLAAKDGPLVEAARKVGMAFA